MGSAVACNLITRVGWFVNSPATIGKQAAVQRQANVAKIIIGPFEGILRKQILCIPWRRQKKERKLGKKKF